MLATILKFGYHLGFFLNNFISIFNHNICHLLTTKLYILKVKVKYLRDVGHQLELGAILDLEAILHFTQ